MSHKLKNLHLSWSRSQRRFCQLAYGRSDFPLILSCRCSLSCRMFSQCQPMCLFRGYSCRNSTDFLDHFVRFLPLCTYPRYQVWHWGALVLDRCHSLGSEWWLGGIFPVCLQLELQHSTRHHMMNRRWCFLWQCFYFSPWMGTPPSVGSTPWMGPKYAVAHCPKIFQIEHWCNQAVHRVLLCWP